MRRLLEVGDDDGSGAGSRVLEGGVVGMRGASRASCCIRVSCSPVSTLGAVHRPVTCTGKGSRLVFRNTDVSWEQEIGDCAFSSDIVNVNQVTSFGV